MSDLPGTGAIEYYLKGLAIRRAKEHQDEQAQLEQQRLQQAMKIADLRDKETQRYHDLIDQNNQANQRAKASDRKIKTFEALTSALKSEQAGFTKRRDPSIGYLDDNGEINSDNLMETPLGTAERLKREGKVQTEKDLSPIMVDRAVQTQKGLIPGKVEEQQALLPGDLFKINTIAHNADVEARKKEAFTEQQNTLNRNLRRDLAHERLTEARAKRMGEQEATNEYVESHLEAIKNGDMTLEELRALPIKERDKIIGEKNKRGYIIPTEKIKARLSEATDLTRFIKIQEQIHNLTKGKTVAENMANGDLTPLIGEADSLAKTFAVNVAGDRSILSEKEVPRIKEGIVTINPVGWNAANPLNWGKVDKMNEAANERRLNSFKAVYKQRLREILGNIPQEQWHSFAQRYNFPINEDTKPKDNKPRASDIPSPIVR